jgi:hypothetical protein
MHRFPAFITAKNLRGALQLYEDLYFDNSPIVRCDGADLRFADPAGICLLAIAARKATENGQAVEIENLPQHQQNYLDRMDVFADCAVQVVSNPCQRFDRHSVLAEVKRLSDSRDTDRAASGLAHAMLGDTEAEDANGDSMRPGDAMYQHQALAYVLTELLGNGLTHAKKHGHGSACAWAACQYYPSNGKLRAAVIDDGCGFYESLRHRYPERVAKTPDLDSIRLAMEPRISSNREVGVMGDSINEGMGLTICRDIVLEAGGTFGVSSGDYHLRITGEHNSAEPIPRWSGALVYMEMPREGLKGVRIGDIVQKYDRGPHQAVRFED